jgi:hypothetical protein
VSNWKRRETYTAQVGDVQVGSRHPVVVQSMTNTDTADVAGTVAQVEALAAAGSELVRVTVNNDAAAGAVPEIVERLRDRGVTTPIIGDFHYNGHLLLDRFPGCARALAKYRINPGNVGTKRRDENFQKIVSLAVEHDKPVRIGVNWGSLDQDLLTELMDRNARLPEPAPPTPSCATPSWRARCGRRSWPRPPGSGPTGSSFRPRSRRWRSSWPSTGSWPRASMPRGGPIRSTWGSPRPAWGPRGSWPRRRRSRPF